MATQHLIQAEGFITEERWLRALREVSEGIDRIVWPPNNPSGEFAIYPESGKKRGKGNGVKPIKDAFLEILALRGWQTADRSNPERFDAVKWFTVHSYLAVEWETGNISSSHRSVNRFLLAHQKGSCLGGFLVLPTAKLARFLTDRVGNWEELQRFFPVWGATSWDDGALAVLAVEHDREDASVPRIAKGTDGRALI